MVQRRLFVILLMAFASLQAYGQTTLPDSIAARFADLPLDSAYIETLNEFAFGLLKTNPVLARRVATHTAELAPDIKYVKGYARSLANIGSSYWYEGSFEFAQNYYLMSARQYQAINDSVGLGNTYNNIGEVYKKMGDYTKALNFLLNSLKLKGKDAVNTSPIILYNIGELYILLNNLDTATNYIDRALVVALRTNDKRAIGYAYNGMGLILMKQRNYQQALDYFTQAEKIWKEIAEMRQLIQCYQNLADIYRELKIFERSERYLDLALEISSIIRVPDLMVLNYHKQARLDSARGDYKKALLGLNRYLKLKDSVYNLAKTEQINRLQMIYELEKNESENKQLKSQQLLKESQLKFQRQIIYAISISLILTGIMAWILYRQRHRILEVNKILQEKNNEIGTQKMAIEMQATALIKLNEELQELNKNLESRIDERTKQLTIQNQRLTEYTFVNAHKLRAPVSSILGLISLIDRTKPEELHVIVDHLKTCGLQLDSITREISRNLEEGIIDEPSDTK